MYYWQQRWLKIFTFFKITSQVFHFWHKTQKRKKKKKKKKTQTKTVETARISCLGFVTCGCISWFCLSNVPYPPATPPLPPPLPPFTKWGSASYLWPIPRVHAKPSKVEKSKIQRSARSKMLQKWLNLTFNHNQPAESLAGWAGQITFLFLNAKIKKSILLEFMTFDLWFFFFLTFRRYIDWSQKAQTLQTVFPDWKEDTRGLEKVDNANFHQAFIQSLFWATQTFKIKGQNKTETKQNLTKKKKKRDPSGETNQMNLLNMQFSFPKHL